MHSKKCGRNHTIPLHLPFGYSTRLRAPHGCVVWLRLLRVVFIGLVNKVRIGLPSGFFSDELWGDGGRAPKLFARGGLRVRWIRGRGHLLGGKAEGNQLSIKLPYSTYRPIRFESAGWYTFFSVLQFHLPGFVLGSLEFHCITNLSSSKRTARW